MHLLNGKEAKSRGMKNRENVLLGTFFLFVPFWLFMSGFIPGNVFNAFDTLTLDIPFRNFAQQMFLKHHELPFWLPGILTGIPLIDSTNLMYFYPPALLTMAAGIPAWATVMPFVALHMLLSAAGMYLFLKACGLNKPAAVLGGFAYMTSGIMVSYVAAGHLGNIIAASYVPWLFYFFRRGHDKGGYFWYVTAGVCIAMQIYCIGMQVMFYSMMLATAYMMFLKAEKDGFAKGAWKALLAMAVASAAGVIFAAPQFIGSLMYIKHSWRWQNSYDLFTSWSFHPGESITFLLPQFFGVLGREYWGFTLSNANTFYMGIIPLILAPAAFMRKEKVKHALFFAVSAAVFLILGFGGNTPLYRVFYYIPVFNSFRTPNRFLYVFTFCVIVLSAIGASNILEKPAGKRDPLKKWLSMMALGTGIVALALFIIVLSGLMRVWVSGLFAYIMAYHVNDNGLNVIMGRITQDALCFACVSAVVFLVLSLYAGKKVRSAYIVLAVLLTVHLLDIYRVEKQFITWVKIGSVAQDDNPAVQFLKKDASIYRAMEPENLSVPNVNLYSGIEFLNGYHGLSPTKYLTMNYDGSFRNLNVTRMLNVKYFLRQDNDDRKGIKLVYDGSPKIFMDPYALPRFYISPVVVNFPAEKEAYNYITKGGFKPGQAVVSGLPSLAGVWPSSATPIAVSEYSPNRIRLRLDTTGGGMLVISDYNYGAWKAVLDNKPVKIYNVNYINMGVPVGSGTHTVEIYFDGWYIIAGIYLALLAFAGYAAWYALGLLKVRREYGKKRK